MKNCIALASLVLALSTIPVLAQKPYSVTSEYDKFKDLTLVSSDFMRVSGSNWNGGQLDLSVQFTYPGRVATPPRGVLLYFWSATSDWRFTELPALRAIADQERLDLGTATEIERQVHMDPSSVSVREYVSVVIPLTLFQKLARAGSVEMQLGNIEFRLSDRHLATLRAVASRMSSK